jgi:hypothetical protein
MASSVAGSYLLTWSSEGSRPVQIREEGSPLWCEGVMKNFKKGPGVLE